MRVAGICAPCRLGSSAVNAGSEATGKASHYSGIGKGGEMTCADRTRPFGSMAQVSTAARRTAAIEGPSIAAGSSTLTSAAGAGISQCGRGRGPDRMSVLIASAGRSLPGNCLPRIRDSGPTD